MPDTKRELTAAEQNLFQTDNTGALYWKGKKVRLSEWSVGDKAAVAAVVIGAIAIITGLVGNYPSVKEFWKDAFGAAKTPVANQAPQNHISPTP